VTGIAESTLERANRLERRCAELEGTLAASQELAEAAHREHVKLHGLLVAASNSLVLFDDARTRGSFDDTATAVATLRASLQSARRALGSPSKSQLLAIAAGADT
jgi:hypothetical protein